MQCIYTVRWHGGSGITCRERADKNGHASAFYAGGTAHITYNVKAAGNGVFLLSYEVKTAAGELVAVNRWQARHDSKHTAAINAIEEACHAARLYDSDAICLVGDRRADDVITALKAAETKEAKQRCLQS